MAIEFNRPHNTAGLNKPAAQGLKHSPAQTNAQDTAKNSSLEQTAKTPVSGESVQLSKDARQLQGLSEKMSNTPSVNSEKVAQLKQAIANGSYQIDNERVASKLLDLEAQL